MADSYDAMSFRRPYRQGLTADECLDELERCSGDQFDPDMVAAFRRVLETIAEGRRTAAGIAGRAAAALTADECIMLREYRDEHRPEYASATAKLRAALRGGSSRAVRHGVRPGGTQDHRAGRLRDGDRGVASPRRRGRHRRRTARSVRRAQAPGQRPLRRPVGRVDQRRRARARRRRHGRRSGVRGHPGD